MVGTIITKEGLLKFWPEKVIVRALLDNKIVVVWHNVKVYMAGISNSVGQASVTVRFRKEHTIDAIEVENSEGKLKTLMPGGPTHMVRRETITIEQRIVLTDMCDEDDEGVVIG